MKGTLTDRGTGVACIVRGPTDRPELVAVVCLMASPHGFLPNHLRDWHRRSDRLQGQSLMPLLREERDEVHDAVFTEQTYHGSPDARPLRAMRTSRFATSVAGSRINNAASIQVQRNTSGTRSATNSNCSPTRPSLTFPSIRSKCTTSSMTPNTLRPQRPCARPWISGWPRPMIHWPDAATGTYQSHA